MTATANKPRSKHTPLGGVQLEQRTAAIHRLDKAGFTQTEIALRIGTSQATVHYHLRKLAEEMRTSRIKDRDANIDRRIAELQLVRQEAWDAWEKSKQDMTMTKQEQGLVKVYSEPDENGKRRAVGEELSLVKVIDSIESRLPGCEYLQVMRQATMDIAKLQGLFEDVTNNNTQINVSTGPAQVGIYLPANGRDVGGSPSGGAAAIDISAQDVTAPIDSDAEVVESPVDDIEVLERDEA